MLGIVSRTMVTMWSRGIELFPWYCMGKKKKGMTCDNINYTDFQLRQITAHILGLEDFDEQVFSEQIEGITVLEDGNLEYHFYKGRTERWQRV